MTRNHRIFAAIPALALLACTVTGRAQVGSGTLTGTIQDTTGATVANARIDLLDVTNGTTQTVKSNGSGFFTFTSLPASTYTATITAPGFNTVKRSRIAVHIGDQINLSNLRLSIAADAASVTVTTEEQIAPTTSGEQSYTLTAKQIEKLNIQGRSAIELLELVPGAANAGNFNSSSYQAPVAGFTQNTSAFSVNGNRFDQVQIVSDGATVTDVQTSGASAVTPNVDMIAESKIQTAAYSSEQPNGPIVVQTETKSGGRKFHGEAYFTARNHALDTTDSRVKSLGLQKPNDSFYYPGGNIGGPVIIPGTSFNKNRDKLFFFFGFEKSIQNVQDPLLDIRQAIVPTAAERTGDFTNTTYLAALGKLDYYQGVQPCSASASGNGYSNAYCGNLNNGKITQIDPGGQALINLFPLPNADPVALGGYNYVSSYTLSQPRDQETTRIDYDATRRNHITFRYNHESEVVPYPYGLYNTFSLTPYPALATNNDHSHSFTGRLATTLPKDFTNELTATLTRFTLGDQYTNASAVSRTANNYPYPNLYNTGIDIVPNVSFGQSPHAGDLYLRGGDFPPYGTTEQTIVTGDQLSKVLHNHLIKGGIYYERDSFNKRTTGQDNGSVSTGYYNNTYNPATAGTGNPFADLLVGSIVSYSQSSANFMAMMLLHRTDFFLQDLWQARPRLTINYGVRVDHIGRWYDINGRNVIFDPTQYNATLPVGNSSGLTNHALSPNVSPSGSLAPGFKVAPSAGFAYDFLGNGKTVLRGGIGTNYYTDPGQNAYSAVQAPPNEQFTTIYQTGATLKSVSALPTTGLYPTVYGIASQQDFRLPVTFSYNLAVAQQLPGRINFQLAYTGNSSRNLSGYTSQNLVPEGCELYGGAGFPGSLSVAQPYTPSYAPGTYNDQLCRPYHNLEALSTEVHNLSSFYNSMQVTASKQTGPVNFWLTYTYGKTMAYNCEDPFNERRCYNPVPFDQSHAVNLSYLINLGTPSKKYLGDHKVLNGALDGWEISGIEQLASGSPIEVSGAPNGLEYDGFHNRTINFYGVSDAANGYNGGPNFDPRVILGTPDEAAVPTITCDPRSGLKKGQFFNPSCFRAPVAATTAPSIGTYHVPYIHGPHFQNDEIGLFKTFAFKDSQRLEIRSQAFNYLNHPVYGFVQYDSALYLNYDQFGGQNVNASAGSPSQKLGSRTIQFSTKYYF
jgi:hypothetical protein